MFFAKIEELSDAVFPDFGCGDHLLLWTWRRVAFGQEDCPSLLRQFIECFGEEGPEVLATARVFLQALEAACPRRLLLGMPGGFALTPDEERVLAMLAAAQRGEADSVDRALLDLARSDLRHVLAITAHALAKAFALNGLCLRGARFAVRVCPRGALAG